MNTRQIIEVLKRKIQVEGDDAGGESRLCALSLSEMVQTAAAVSTLKQVRAFGERVPEHNTRLTSFDLVTPPPRVVVNPAPVVVTPPVEKSTTTTSTTVEKKTDSSSSEYDPNGTTERSQSSYNSETSTVGPQ